MTQLAAFPNVNIKLSGAPREDLHANTYDDWSVAEIRPYVAHVLAVFGYDRVMYGGNWYVRVGWLMYGLGGLDTFWFAGSLLISPLACQNGSTQ
jgi:hypothetical protein